jgi:PAS domain S-box-containing protein
MPSKKKLLTPRESYEKYSLPFSGPPSQNVEETRDCINKEQIEKLTNSHVRILKILNSIDDLFIVLDDNWHFTFINKATGHFLNQSIKEVIGRSIWDVIPSYNDTEFYWRLANAMETKRTAEFEFEDSQSGQWYSYKLFPSEDIFTILGSNVTEQKKAAELVLQSRERYQTFISKSAEGIWRFEIEKPIPVTLPTGEQLTEILKHTVLAECNNAIAKRYGYSRPEEIVGASMEKLFTGTKLINYLPLFISSGYHLSNMLVKERGENGKVKYFLNNMVGITEGGFLKRIWGTKRDITEEKLTEMSLQETQQKLRLSLSAGQVSTWLWNITEDKIEWNNEQSSLYGSDCPNPCSFKEWLKLIYQEDAKKLEKTINDSIQAKKEMNTEFRVVWPDESIHWILFKCVPQYDENGEPSRLVGVNIDITDRILLEKEKEDFIAITSHELKTPLTSIKGYAEILLEELLEENNDRLAPLAKKMILQVERLNNLIKELLDVTKINEGQLIMEPAYFDFNEFIKEVAEEMQNTTTTHQLIVEGQVTPLIWADKNKIREVAINLISNGIKYSPEGDKVIIRPVADEENLTVSIKDFGIGLSKEHQSKLFSRFYRVNNSGRHTFPGLGLGLYISAEIIKKHNGKIWLESERNNGSEFYFSIPLRKEK